MQKLLVTKEQFEALELITESIEKTGDINSKLMLHYTACTNESPWRGEYKPLNDLKMDEFAAALINGYEQEKTIEEKIVELYKSYEGELNFDYVNGAQSAIEKMVKILGMKGLV